VSPEAWRILETLGVADRIRALRPRPIRGMRITAPDGTSFCGDYRGATHPGFAMRRQVLDHALLAAAREAGVEVREKHRATGLLRSADGRVTGVTFAAATGEQRAAARLVVGCDGRRSVVGRRLGLLRHHRSLRKFAVRGHWEGVQALEERGEMHVGGGGYCGVAPLSATLANVAFVLDQDDMLPAAGDLEGFYRRTLRRWPRLAERLDKARLVTRPRAIGPLALQAIRVSAPGALLVGDAAGFYDPFTGEGVTLALRSAELAAAVIRKCIDSLDDLAAYDRVRDAATRDKFRLNRLLQRIVAWPELSNLVARRVQRRPAVADRLVSIAGDFVPAREALGLDLLWELVR